MTYVAIGISVLAVVFTIGSFWWLHARKGSLEATRPPNYAFAASPEIRLRFPLAFFNTGAKALIVTDLRVVFDDKPTPSPFRWLTTRTKLRPEKEDGFAFATPFTVGGRGAREVVAEFGEVQGWSPQALSRHRLRLQAEIHPSENWTDVVTFDWWAPSAEKMTHYIAHRNEPYGLEVPD